MYGKWDPISCKSKDIARNCGKCHLFPPNLSKMAPRESMRCTCALSVVPPKPSEFALKEDGRKESLWCARNSRGESARERERESLAERCNKAIKVWKGEALHSSVQSRQSVAKAKGKGSVRASAPNYYETFKTVSAFERKWDVSQLLGPNMSEGTKESLAGHLYCTWGQIHKENCLKIGLRLGLRFSILKKV